ncbi:MAG: hypothetical protein IT443_02660 [Phycisphaeraceae bacterium]|nr:hypothetical protein [Phycisphaeraceae bacterium]
MHFNMRLVVAAALFVSTGQSAWALLTGNLVSGGDFESTSALKTQASPDGILTHRFSQQYDVGKWLAKWGPPSQDGGFGGFSTYNNPRDVGETGGVLRDTGDLGNVNRSVDPLNPSNHILEPIMFRPRWGQWVAAPANHVPGTIKFSFDYMQGNWMGDNGNWGYLWLMGLNELPPHDVSYCTDGGVGMALTPLGGDALEGDGTAAGDVLIRYVYGDWMAADFAAAGKTYLNTWHHVSSDNPDPLYWGDLGPGGNELTVDLDQTYPYYVIVNYSIVYGEGHMYFWLLGGQVSDTFAQGFDNFSLQLPIAVAGDFNDDGQVTLSDINPFKLALTDSAAWQAQYPDAYLPVIDPNGDGVVTLSDINPFKQLLTGGQAVVIPEPGAMAMLAAGAVLAFGRRR